MSHRVSSRFPVVVLGAIAALLLGATRAESQYLDPGSASIIVQAVVAAVVAVGATLKLYWRQIGGLFSRRRARDPEKE